MARPCAVDRRMCNSCKSYRRRHRERFGFAADRPQAAIFNPRPTTKPADRKSEKIPSFEDEDSLTWQEWVRLTGYDPQTRTYRP